MNLVTCPSCQHVFSPTPGQKVKCPACLRVLATQSTPSTPSTRPARSRADDFEDEGDSSSSAVVIGVIAAIVMILLVVGGGMFFLMSKGPSIDTSDPVAVVTTRPKTSVTPLPDIVDPVVPAPPRPKTSPPVEPVTGDPMPPMPPTPPMSPTTVETPKSTPKVRVIDPKVAPETPPEPAVTKKLVIKNIAGVDPTKVDTAIRRGVAYLQATAPEWLNSGNHPLGYAALGGLTMLECNVPTNNPGMQQVAGLVRKLAPICDNTYEISLAILFLDRLGQSDKKLIQTLASRLIAGQDVSGGWTYHCPILTPQDTSQLLAILQRTRPAPAPPILALTISGDEKGPAKAIKKDEKKDDKGDPFESPFDRGIQSPNDLNLDPGTEPKLNTGSVTADLGGEKPQPPKILPKSRMNGQSAVAPGPASAPTTSAGGLSRVLQFVPTVAQRDRVRTAMVVDLSQSPSDLSNTQFVLLALWAARRHGVASERALILTEIRLRQTQLSNGSWRYKLGDGATDNPAMTCVGLLGMALGSAVQQPHAASLHRVLQTDPVIQRGLDHLSQRTGDPLASFDAVTGGLDHYTLWSTERVAVLYNLTTIRGKDWYGWGAQNFLKNQGANGSWLGNPAYHSSTHHVDTCFALLFLIRSNLVQEITDQIRLQMPIQER
jgi:hypothetical protein